jgi:hypothetical protein
MSKKTRSNALFARRADLPLSGRIQGQITIVQEDRFRLLDEQGRGFLFTLGRKSGLSARDLHAWNRARTPVTVQYEGPPDLGATAVRIEL